MNKIVLQEGLDKNVQAQIEVYVAQANEYIDIANKTDINDVVSSDVGNNTTVNIKDLAKTLDEIRKVIVKPSNDKVKQVNGIFKQVTEPLKEAAKILGDKVVAFKLEENARIEKELAKNPDDVEAIALSVSKQKGMISRWTYEIENPLKVPAAFMMIDDAAVKSYIKEHKELIEKGKKKIQGLKFVKTTTHRS